MQVLKNLKALVTLPYATPDGRIVATHGYDPETELYLDTPPTWTPHIPESPTKEEIKRAVCTLMGPWGGYMFHEAEGKQGASAGAAVAAVLTAVCRPVLGAAPCIFLDAPEQGSGKTQFALALGGLIMGAMPAVKPYAVGEADAELKKALLAGAMAGSVFTCIDNVTGLLKSPTLAALLTTGRMEDRILQVSKNWAGACAALITLTGNNATLARDFQRRTLRIRINGGKEPTRRRFAFTPQDAAIKRRRAIAEAACVVWRGYFAAGAPRLADDDVGGYVDWNRLCRLPVLWLAQEGMDAGLPWKLGDPAASMLADASGDDPDEQATADLLGDLFRAADGREFTAADVLKWIDGDDRGPHLAPCPELRAVLRDIIGQRWPITGSPRSKTISTLLKNRRDQSRHGYKLTMREMPKEGARFRVLWEGED